MAIFRHTSLTLFAPVYLPFLLLLPKYAAMKLKDVDDLTLFTQLGEAIAFCGLTFYVWAATQKANGQPVGPVKKDGSPKAKGEAHLLIIAAVVQISVYLFAVYGSTKIEDVATAQFSDTIFMIGSVLVPYGIRKGVIVT
jgi:hypothetical protein